MRRAAVLWTGGKDSSLALYEAKLAGWEIVNLVTFAPPEPKFLAHPLDFIKLQAEALALPHCTLEIQEPYRESYKKAILFLSERYKVDTLITGDIAEVQGHPNTVIDCCRNLDVSVFAPLWGCNRVEVIQRIFLYKFKVIFSLVKKPWFTAKWVGRDLNIAALQELVSMNAETGVDISGEQGEYHTMVLDGPLFHKAVSIDKYSVEKKDSLMFMSIEAISLKSSHENS